MFTVVFWLASAASDMAPDNAIAARYHLRNRTSQFFQRSTQNSQNLRNVSPARPTTTQHARQAESLTAAAPKAQ